MIHRLHLLAVGLCLAAGCTSGESVPPSSDPGASSGGALALRPGGARLLVFDRYEDNFLTQAVLEAEPELAAHWRELLDVRQALAEFYEVRGELGSVMQLDKRGAEALVRPEELKDRGRYTVILSTEARFGGEPFTAADRDALRARLGELPDVQVVLDTEVRPPEELQRRDLALQESFDQERFTERLRELAPRQPLARWEERLGEKLYLGDVIETAEGYRGTTAFIVGERKDGTPCVFDPHRGEYYVTPPAYLVYPGRVPLDHWTKAQEGILQGVVDCVPVDHAFLREQAIEDDKVLLEGERFHISKEVQAVLADPASDQQIYLFPMAGELWTYPRKATLGPR